MIHKTLVLLGSGEFTKKVEVIDKQIIFKIKEKPSVAIIPTASGEEPDCWKWVDMGIKYFSKMDVEAFGLGIFNKIDADKQDLIKEIEKANIIYFSGGNPGYLLEVLSKSLIWKKILHMYKNGTVIAASSAGAMVMGKYVLCNPYQLQDAHVQIEWKKGLNLTEFSIIPHYDYIVKYDKSLYEKVISQTPTQIKNTLLGIDENTAVFLENRKIKKVFGLGNIVNIATGNFY